MKDQRELVVLSACKTSVGEHKKGEGLYSITRGFINSGAKSVVSTLLNVNEKSSSIIISHFYKGFANGNNKSNSLRPAKLTYISSNKNTSLASPFYWSSIILIGNNSVINSNDSIWQYLTLGFLIFSGVILIWFFIKRR